MSLTFKLLCIKQTNAKYSGRHIMKSSMHNNIKQNKVRHFSEEFPQIPATNVIDVFDSADLMISSHDESAIEKSDVLFSTGDLAKEFNVTPQTIRNTQRYFGDILSNEHRSNERIYTSADVEIFSLIFKMKNKQKYSRKAILEYFLNNGVYSKNDDVYCSEKAPALTSTELMQKKINEGLNVLQDNLSTMITEGLLKIEQGLATFVSNEVQNSTKCIIEKLNSDNMELNEVLKHYNDVLSSCDTEFSKFKGTLNNINHTSLKIEQLVQSDNNSQLLRKDIQTVIKGMDSVISGTINNQVNDKINDLKRESQNNAKLIRNELSKQQQTFANLENIFIDKTKLTNNNNQGIRKAELADYFNRNYQKIAKTVNDSVDAQNQALITQLTEVLSSFNDVDGKINELMLINEQLEKENRELHTKNSISGKIISKQTDQINLLQKNTMSPVEDNRDSSAALSKKLFIAEKLIEKLTQENDSLKKKAVVSNRIIEMQENEIARFNSGNSTIKEDKKMDSYQNENDNDSLENQDENLLDLLNAE